MWRYNKLELERLISGYSQEPIIVTTAPSTLNFTWPGGRRFLSIWSVKLQMEKSEVLNRTFVVIEDR